MNNILKIKKFNYNEFTKNNFVNFIMESFMIDSSYTILIQLEYEGNSNYIMCGSQIKIQVLEIHNTDMYTNIYNVINLRIIELLEDYNIDTSPNSIIIRYKPLTQIENISISPNKVKEYYSSLKGSDFKKIELKNLFSFKYLPLSLNNNSFGSLIQGDLKTQYINILKNNIINRIGEIPFLLNENILNISKVFFKKIHLNKNEFTIIILDLSIKDLLFLKNTSINTYTMNLFNINQSEFFNLEGFIRIVYDLNSGITLYRAIDIIKSIQQFERNINNYKLLVEKDELIELSRSLKLDYIKAPKFKYSSIPNNNIGVLDVETFTNSNGLGQVYCIGYGTLNDMENIETFYLTDTVNNLNSDLLIIHCINSMLDKKYHNYY